jgi:hypothetical protein
MDSSCQCRVIPGRVENGKETFRSFPEKKETKSKKRKRKRYYAEKERKRNILNGNERGNG